MKPQDAAAGPEPAAASRRGVELRAHVAAYLMDGLALVPCDGKRPVRKGWQTAPVRAFEDWPAGDRLNVGVHLGKSGLVAVDADGPAGAMTLARLLDAEPAHLRRHLLQLGAAGVCHRGANGRFQALFKAPAEPLTRTHLGGCELLELRAGRHQSVLPPSVHPSGARYEWLDGRFDPGAAAVLPAELLPAADDPAPARTLRPVPDDLEQIPPPAYFRALAGVDAPDGGGLVCCPLHDDRTPSCNVDAASGWYCHGCGRGGGIYQLAAMLLGITASPLRGADFIRARDAARGCMAGTRAA